MKTYLEILNMFRGSGDKKLYVAVIYPTGGVDWLPVDKGEYIRQLSMIDPLSAKNTSFPCYVETESDGEMYIHPKVKDT
jgi:hypothetical protein